jgi:hypothetical protein
MFLKLIHCAIFFLFYLQKNSVLQISLWLVYREEPYRSLNQCFLVSQQFLEIHKQDSLKSLKYLKNAK